MADEDTSIPKYRRKMREKIEKRFGEESLNFDPELVKRLISFFPESQGDAELFQSHKPQSQIIKTETLSPSTTDDDPREPFKSVCQLFKALDKRSIDLAKNKNKLEISKFRHNTKPSKLKRDSTESGKETRIDLKPMRKIVLTASAADEESSQESQADSEEEADRQEGKKKQAESFDKPTEPPTYTIDPRMKKAYDLMHSIALEVTKQVEDMSEDEEAETKLFAAFLNSLVESHLTFQKAVDIQDSVEAGDEYPFERSRYTVPKTISMARSVRRMYQQAKLSTQAKDHSGKNELCKACAFNYESAVAHIMQNFGDETDPGPSREEAQAYTRDRVYKALENEKTNHL